MAPTPEGPSASEAARALQDIDRRRDQAHDATINAPWVNVVFGVATFALFAAPDFFGRGATGWTPAAYALLAVAYVALLNTRRGSALLGQAARLRKQEVSRRFALRARLALVAVVLAGFAVELLHPHWHLNVPYWRTMVGAAAGAALILFGKRWQKALVSLAVRGGHDARGRVVHGPR